MVEGIKVTVTDLATGESMDRTIVNDYCLVTDGDHYLDGIQRHANGTVVLTIKRERR